MIVMKLRTQNKADAVQSALAVTLCVLSAVAILYFFYEPPRTGDSGLNALLGAVIPRFFISLFLLVLTLEFFPSCLDSKRVPLKALLWCVPPLFVTLVNFPVSALAMGTAHLTRMELFALFVCKCFLIGVSEEVLFRGIIFHALSERFEKAGRSCFLPVLLSSVIFSLFHFVNLLDGAGILPVLQQAGYSFLIGAMLAVTLLKTKNLWLCVFLHTLFDMGGFIVSDLGTGNPQDLVFWILTIIIGVLCTVHIVLTLVRMVKRQKKSN